MFQTSYDLQCGQGCSTACSVRTGKWNFTILQIPCTMEGWNSKRVTHIMQHEGFWFKNGNSNSTVPQIPCEMKGSSFRSYEYHAKTTITKSEMLQYAKKRFQLATNKPPKITSGIGVCLLRNCLKHSGHIMNNIDFLPKIVQIFCAPCFCSCENLASNPKCQTDQTQAVWL